MPLFKGTTTQAGARKCPHCGVEFTRLRVVTAEIEIRPGLLGICGDCAGIWVIADNMLPRVMEPGELFDLLMHDPRDELLAAQEAARARLKLKAQVERYAAVQLTLPGNVSPFIYVDDNDDEQN